MRLRLVCDRARLTMFVILERVDTNEARAAQRHERLPSKP
jgi:hypothetical protein